MSTAPALSRPAIEVLDAHPEIHVQDAEYRRLLGYPPDHVPSERARELASWARRTFAEQGRPWVYLREAKLQITEDALLLDGVAFHSRQLHQHLLQSGARRAVFAVVSAGRGCEEHARQLWQESKPDEYFFLETFGSAVVEHLVAVTSGRICDLAENEGLMAIPHYSPGYAGWDVVDQTKLFDLITRGQTQLFPEKLEVLSSGMLRPKKSLLAVFGLTPRTPHALAAARLIPCENCSFSPCRYRRVPYRHAANSRAAVVSAAPPVPAAPTYSVNQRALRKWAQERVRLAPRADGSLAATFRFDGTTCSNMGRPLAFDYVVTLSRPEDNYTILEADCRPSPDDEGHKFMCAYLSDADSLLHALATEKPLLGRPLNDVLTWSRTSASSGCHCDAQSRTHKWGLALEAIHFALSHSQTSSSSIS